MDTAATLAALSGAMLPMEWQGDDLFEEDFDGLVSVLTLKRPQLRTMMARPEK